MEKIQIIYPIFPLVFLTFFSLAHYSRVFSREYKNNNIIDNNLLMIVSLLKSTNNPQKNPTNVGLDVVITLNFSEY